MMKNTKLDRLKTAMVALATVVGVAATDGAAAQIVDKDKRFIPMEGTLNTRDIGGYPAADGKQVVWGKIFRSANLAQISEHDVDVLTQRNIKTVIDFRGPKEARDDPDHLPAGAQYINSPVMGDAKGDALDRARIESLLAKENMPPGMYDEQKVLAVGPYYRMLALVNNYGTADHMQRIKGYKPLFQALLKMPEDQSILYHCTGGRDRTGVGTALFLRTLGVPDAKIKEDFVASNYYLQPDRDNPDSTAYTKFKSANLFIQPPENKRFQALAKDLGTTPSQIRNAVVLKPELLDKLFAGIDRDYGSFDNFLQQEMGIGPQEVATLRAKYTR